MQTVAIVAAVANTAAQVSAAKDAAEQQARMVAQKSAQAAANLRMQANQQQIASQTAELEQRQLDIQRMQELTRGKQEETERARELRSTLSTIDAIRASRGLSLVSPTSRAITNDIRDAGMGDIRTTRMNTRATADTLRLRSEYAGSLSVYNSDTARFYDEQAEQTIENGRTSMKSALRAGRMKQISALAGGLSGMAGGRSGGMTVPGTGSQPYVNSSGIPVPGNKPTRISF